MHPHTMTRLFFRAPPDSRAGPPLCQPYSWLLNKNAQVRGYARVSPF